MTSHVIAYRSLELLFGTHTYHFNCFFEDFNCVFTQIRCLSRVLKVICLLFLLKMILPYSGYGHFGHLGHVFKTIHKILANLSYGVSIWILSSIGQVVSEKTVFIKFQYEWPWLKGKRPTLTFGTYYRFNISSENNNLPFKSIQNINYQKVSHLIAP